MPATIIRLAAGRQTLSETEQAMCFMAGANAVFTGEQMLTTPCKYMRYCVWQLSTKYMNTCYRLSVGRSKFLIVLN